MEIAPKCDSLDSHASEWTPVYLYKTLGACIENEMYEEAILYFALAGTFGRYDTYRVRDMSAHQIVGSLKNAALASANPDKKAKFQALAGAAFDDKVKHSALCLQIKGMGPPTYEPLYMTQHGLDAMLKPSSTPATPKDVLASWPKALGSYLSCM